MEGQSRPDLLQDALVPLGIQRRFEDRAGVLPADPPYPNILRYVAIFDLERRKTNR